MPPILPTVRRAADRADFWRKRQTLRRGPRGGGVRLPKFDYTSYEDDIPYYTMIVIEDREKKKLLLDLNQELLFALKKQYPSKVFA